VIIIQLVFVAHRVIPRNLKLGGVETKVWGGVKSITGSAPIQDKSCSKEHSQAYVEAIPHSEEGTFQTQPRLVNSITTVT